MRCQMAQDKRSWGETLRWPLPLSPILSHTLKPHGHRGRVEGRGEGAVRAGVSMKPIKYTQAKHWLTPKMERYQGMPWQVRRQAGIWIALLKIWLACCTASRTVAPAPTFTLSAISALLYLEMLSLPPPAWCTLTCPQPLLLKQNPGMSVQNVSEGAVVVLGEWLWDRDRREDKSEMELRNECGWNYRSRGTLLLLFVVMLIITPPWLLPYFCRQGKS